MKTKKKLLAELTLMQEAAQNAQKNGLDVVAFHTKRIAEFAEAAKAALEDSSKRPPLDKGKVRVTVECDEDVQTFDTSALKMFFLLDGELKGREYMLECSEYDECCFYVALKERTAKLNAESNGKFEKIYQKYLKEFSFEEILQGDE